MIRSISTPRGTILVREGHPSDAVQFRELRLNALLDSPVAFSADYEKNLHYPQNYWENMLTPQPDESIIFLAEHEENLVGMCGIARGGSPKTRHGATIWGVYVAPEWRGLHIAEELIRSCLAWAKALKVEFAKLGVETTNNSAIRCYERCGFTTYAMEPRALFYEGKYYDFYSMFCALDKE